MNEVVTAAGKIITIGNYFDSKSKKYITVNEDDCFTQTMLIKINDPYFNELYYYANMWSNEREYLKAIIESQFDKVTRLAEKLEKEKDVLEHYKILLDFADI